MPARLAADRQAAGDLPRLEVDPHDLVTHADGHIGRPAVVGDRHPRGSGPTSTRPTTLSRLGPTSRIATSYPYQCVTTPRVPSLRQRDARRLLPRRDLVEHPARRRVDQRDRARGLVRREQPAAVGRKRQRDRRAVRLVGADRPSADAADEGNRRQCQGERSGTEPAARRGDQGDVHPEEGSWQGAAERRPAAARQGEGWRAVDVRLASRSIRGRTHIRSITSIPSKLSPNFKVRAVRSPRASRLSRRSGDSALSTGHSS